MNWQLLGPLLVTTVVAIFGWFAAHHLAAVRDRANKRRELIVKYLVEAYRRLESSSNRAGEDCDPSALESAIADVQLFGSSKQVHLAQDFARSFAAEHSASLDDLLATLRQDLRVELNLEPVPREVKYLRVVKQEKRGAQRGLAGDGQNPAGRA